MKSYNEIETWERCEGGETAYNFEGELLIEIEALQDRYDRAKWGGKVHPRAVMGGVFREWRGHPGAITQYHPGA